MGKLWNGDTNRKDAEDLLKAILPFVNENSISVNISELHQITIAQKELLYSSNNLDENLLLKALIKSKAESDASLVTLEKNYCELEREKKKVLNTPSSRWELIIPFNVKTSKRTIHIFDKTFYICSKKTLKARYKNAEFLASKALTIEDLPNSSLKVVVKAVSLRNAWKKIESVYSLLQGIVDYSTTERYISKISFTKRSKLVSHTIILGISDQNNYEALLFVNDSKQPLLPVTFNKQQETTFKYLIDLFRKNPDTNSAEELIQDALRIYALAKDAIHDHNCFLHLWQMAERMSLVEDIGGDTGTVAKRLNIFSNNFALFGSGYSHILKKFGKKRNDIVHCGIYNIDIHDINILEDICEGVLRWIISNRKNLKTEAYLSKYYSLFSKGDKELANVKQEEIVTNEVVSFIEKNRK